MVKIDKFWVHVWRKFLLLARIETDGNHQFSCFSILLTNSNQDDVHIFQRSTFWDSLFATFTLSPYSIICSLFIFYKTSLHRSPQKICFSGIDCNPSTNLIGTDHLFYLAIRYVQFFRRIHEVFYNASLYIGASTDDDHRSNIDFLWNSVDLYTFKNSLECVALN